MKQLAVLPLPPGLDASPSQGYPQQSVTSIKFIYLFIHHISPNLILNIQDCTDN